MGTPKQEVVGEMAVAQNQWDPILGAFGEFTTILEPILEVGLVDVHWYDLAFDPWSN